MINRPITTLFMLSSVDGKISTGDTDIMDTDSDFRKIKGIKEGVQQYYDLEKTTDMHFLITGRVMAKNCESLNVNNRKDEPTKLSANCIIIDGAHLKESGVLYLLKKFNSLTVVTANRNHPAKKIKSEKPDLILLDLILPGIYGFEVLSRMKGDPVLSRIPVIILSNLGQKEDVEKGLKLGAIDYLIKAHFTPGEIIEKIRANLK